MSLDEHLHASPESQHEVKGAFLLDVIIRQGSATFELLSSKDQSLLIRRNAFLVLDLCLHVFNAIRGFNFERDGLSRESLDKHLHASPESQHEVKGAFLLDVIIGQGSAIFELLASKDQSLLIRRNAFLVLDLCLHVFNATRGFNFERD